MRARQAAFTLVELLVALFITTILFAMGYGALSQALTNRKEVDEQAARLNAVQQALRVMEQDFELMQPRPVRDQLGNGFEAPLVVNQSVPLTMTRGGWANPAGLPRSELQRVSYLLRDGQLIRQHLPVLDATAAVPYEEQALLDQVEALSFRYMDGGLVWQTSWPPPAFLLGPPQELLRARPVAVEVTLELKDWGTLTRIFEVAG
jgi:general secretion pathway protein J